MRKLLFILALLFAGCSEENPEKIQCFSMILSDALPVQFWLNNCETYNEKQVCGINHFCFCQPFECNDEIKVQFTDTFTDYVTEEVIVPITFPALSTWLTTSISASWVNWTLGSNPSVNITYSSLTTNYSEYLYTDYDFDDGKTYSVTFNFTRTEYTGFGAPSVFILLLDGANNVIDQQQYLVTSTGSNSRTHTFTATEAMTRIAFRTGSFASNYSMTVTSVSGTRTDTITTYPDPVNYSLNIIDEDSVEIESIPFTAQLLADSFAYVYTASWTPIDSDVCNSKVAFQIENTDDSTIVAKTDCIEIRESWECTNVITYSNNRNYAGLAYTDVSPDQQFSIRVPSRFFHEQNPEEDELMQLSSSFINTSSTIQAKKLFEVIHAPYYWHRKLQLIFKHSYVEIDDQVWIKQDGYEINEGNKRASLKSAQVWLTEKDNLQRNVL